MRPLDQMGGPGLLDRGGRVPARGPRLNGAQQNDASAWLPNNAESTQVVELASGSRRATSSRRWWSMSSRARHPRRPGQGGADAERFAGLDHVGGGRRPDPRQRRPCAGGGRAGRDGQRRLERRRPVVEEVRSIARSGGGSVHVTGPAGYATDFADVFSGFDATLLYITAAIVIVILLLTYRSPVLWCCP